MNLFAVFEELYWIFLDYSCPEREVEFGTRKREIESDKFGTIGINPGSKVVRGKMVSRRRER